MFHIVLFFACSLHCSPADEVWDSCIFNGTNYYWTVVELAAVSCKNLLTVCGAAKTLRVGVFFNLYNIH